jgi:hypothetical protein
MGKKVILTEQQLKSIVKVVKEQQFDEAITKFNKEKNQGVSMPLDDAKLLINVGVNWCHGKDTHPDCEEIYRIRSDFNLYN